MDYCLFDLDGTLTDPYEGITNSIKYGLAKFGICENDTCKLKSFIGPPLYRSFMDSYSFTQEQAAQAVGYYREYFAQKGIFESRVYDGIKNMLYGLKQRDFRLLVATSKPQVFAERIIKHFNLWQYFDFIAGATLDDSRVEKADVISYALKSCNIAPYNAIMVGDRKHDIIGAKKNGLNSVGVLYGYGGEDELKSAGADYIAATPSDVAEILINLKS